MRKDWEGAAGVHPGKQMTLQPDLHGKGQPCMYSCMFSEQEHVATAGFLFPTSFPLDPSPLGKAAHIWGGSLPSSELPHRLVFCGHILTLCFYSQAFLCPGKLATKTTHWVAKSQDQRQTPGTHPSCLVIWNCLWWQRISRTSAPNMVLTDHMWQSSTQNVCFTWLKSWFLNFIPLWWLKLKYK